MTKYIVSCSLAALTVLAVAGEHRAIAPSAYKDATHAAVSQRATVLRNGEDAFLFGVYHVSWINNRYEPQRYEDLEIVASSGLNTMVASLDPSTYKTTLQFIETSQKKRVSLIAELYLPSLGILIDMMKDYPAIIAWQIGDDFNVTNSSNYATPETLKTRHQMAKAHDITRLTYASGATTLVKWYRSFRDYRDCVDMVGMQVYPIGNESDFPFNDALEISHQLFRARVGELAGLGIIPVANLQSFSWKKTPTLFPTASESRNMLYGALDAGVKSVMYYAFYEGKNADGKSTLPEQCPLLWEEIRKQAAEVKTIEDFLLDGKRTQLETPFRNIHASIWKQDEDSILILFSTERKLSRHVEISVPGVAHGRLEPLFEGRPSGIQFGNGMIKGSVGAEEVHVYQFKEN